MDRDGYARDGRSCSPALPLEEDAEGRDIPSSDGSQKREELECCGLPCRWGLSNETCLWDAFVFGLAQHGRGHGGRKPMGIKDTIAVSD